MTQLTARHPARPRTPAWSNPLPALKETLASAGLRRPRFVRGERIEHPVDAPVLRTERLLLRPHRVTEADAADWHDLQSEPAVREFLPWPEHDRRRSERHLRDRTRHTRLWQADDFLALAVELDGHVIGDVSLHLRRVAASGRTVEMGWVVHPSLGGRGYATEAAAALLGFALTTVGAQRVTAVTDARNTRSVALAKRLGLVAQTARASGDPEVAPGETLLALSAAPAAAPSAARA
ncbi:GNAT family N-acetyltransferase [Herbiconiux sp. VKM Ac-1786]|uniref:GNAT family N-acetyltransferase n=1 Tax=Herbiconiux sp. VKM Ac-1786 TaxID=2783824 RepID=UPI00188B3956|nr:GNAT family N-acetyltransferase [Herbiconiux sp. VKM Ac-1786]MBF4571596.1 GNAT family N-acetyltransferase [Herbiconiux sp. VKM Ac-1786]